MSEPKEVWITGIGLATSLGEGLDANWDALNARRINVDEKTFAPYVVHPWVPVDSDSRIPKKGDQRQMEAWQRIGTYAAGLALDSAGVKGNKEILGRMDMIVAAGGGERDLAVDCSILNPGSQRQLGARLPQRAADERPAPDPVSWRSCRTCWPATSRSCMASADSRAPSWARKPPASTRPGSRWRGSPRARATSR